MLAPTKSISITTDQKLLDIERHISEFSASEMASITISDFVIADTPIQARHPP